MKRRHHFFNMYFTTTISIALVLFLIGVEAIVLLSAHNLIQQMRENVAITLILKDNSDSIQQNRLENLLQVAPFVHHWQYISKEDALNEHISNLGEDPTKFLGTNPLQASYEINLNAQYAQVDSIATIEKKLLVFPFIDQIIYPKDMITILDGKIGTISIILLGLVIVLLIVALALIVNTIRLHVYSKRFLINTMQLVGATPWVIKRPIIGRNILMGFVAGIFALILLAGSIYYCQVQLNVILFPLNYMNIGFICTIVLVTGILITGFAALGATNKFIRMKTDDLYYV